MPLEAPINSDNRRYLTAKAARAGHQLNHVLAALAESADVADEATPLAP
jgi:GTP cyclohydrolase II